MGTFSADVTSSSGSQDIQGNIVGLKKVPREPLVISHSETYSHGCSLVSPSGALKKVRLGVSRGVRWQHQHFLD